MSRLAATAKALYFPTPPRVVDLIVSAVTIVPPGSGPFVRKGALTIFDPCAGEGAAAAALGKAWDAETYGIELDALRALKAKGAMTSCLHGSYHQASVPGKFDVLLLNPPYASDKIDGVSTRQEIHFLADTLEHLDASGLLVYIVPRAIIASEPFARLASQQLTSWAVREFPDPELRQFDQVVFFATRGHRHIHNAKPAIDGLLATIKPLGEGAAYGWRPSFVSGFKPGMAISGTAPESYAPSLEAATFAWGSSQWEMLTGPRGAEAGQPLVMPRPGHQAMLLAAGAIDGTEIAGGLLIKGGSEKITVTLKEGKETIERERIASRLSVLDMASGEFDTWRADEQQDRTSAWFSEHGSELADALSKAYSPSFNGDISRHAAVLARLNPPGVLPGHARPEFLPVQVHAAAAIAHKWARGEKSTILSGEMGIGKTVVAILAAEFAGFERVIVSCPSHLVAKWIREYTHVTGRPGVAVTAKRVSEVDAFFASKTARVLVLSKDMAKLGARWEHRFTTKKKIHKQVIRRGGWGYSWETPEVIKTVFAVVTCPDCGAEQADADKVPLTPLSIEKLKTRTSCTACKAPLWQSMPISDKGTLRWPLAKYINRHYRQQYALVVDEAHQVAKADSDQARAAQDLISSATKVVAMTGTVYGGRASSLFHLLYKLSHAFRTVYGYGEIDRFVEHHGLFERRYEEEERTSVYGYRRGGKRTGGRIREIPGMSPAMIPMMLPFTQFLKLRDLQLDLPPYTEEVVLLDADPRVFSAVTGLASEVKELLRENPEVLGQYLMACLGYPDRPEEEEKIVVPETGALIASAPALAGCVLAKDDHLVELVRDERAAGRTVLVYFAQTHRRDARGRVRERLEAEGLRVVTLDASVAPEKREAWIADRVKAGFDVMLTNGRLVETGMDLLFAHTIVQYGIEYSIPTLRQSVRRSWRLGQSKPVRVIFLAYAGTMQALAMNLIARKMRAAELVDGDENGGLAQFDETGGNFLLELAQEAVKAREAA